jgi:hypothetical protein
VLTVASSLQRIIFAYQPSGPSEGCHHPALTYERRALLPSKAQEVRQCSFGNTKSLGFCVGGPTGRDSVAPQKLPDAVSIAPYFIEDVLKLRCSSRLLSQSARPGKILCGVHQLPELARECCPPCCLTSASSARVAVYMTRLPDLDALRKKVVCSGDEGVPSTM